MNNQLFSDWSSQNLHFIPNGLEEVNARGYDNVFIASLSQDEKFKEVKQDWSSFGIIDYSLALQGLNQEASESQIPTGQITTRPVESFSTNCFNESSINSESELRSNGREDSKEAITIDSDQETIREDQIRPSKRQRSLAETNKEGSSNERVRADAKIKRALRFTKRHIKKLFKSMNSKIVHKRYVNCSADKIFERMKLALLSILPEELLADDLVYYTIGILNLKKPSQLDCKKKIKKEISEFVETNTKFTYKKLKKAMQSNCLRVLCRYMISQADESISETLEQILDSE